MAGDRVERRLAAILAADVAGYSRLMGADEEGTLARLKAVRKAVIDPALAFHRGRIVKTTGDGVLAEFASAVEAVRCAVELQRGIFRQNDGLPQTTRIEFRIGIHVGDIIVDDSDIFGDGVNIAARLEGIAEPGGISISGAAYDQVRDKVPFSFVDLGDQTLKNIARPVSVYGIAARETTREETIGQPNAAVRRSMIALVLRPRFIRPESAERDQVSRCFRLIAWAMTPKCKASAMVW